MASGLVRKPLRRWTAPAAHELAAYCHFTANDRRSPVGLSLRAILKKVNNPEEIEKLNRLFQELAKPAGTRHAVGGVKAVAKP